MKSLINKIKKLKQLGVIGIKQSLEDEGSSFEDLYLIRNITKKNNLKLNVKIGGCEAKNDIFYCSNLKSDSIVAPMVESEYALSKFILAVPKKYKGDLFINLETKTSFDNISKILNSKHFKRLRGVVIGRSDLSGSYNLSKSEVDSKKIFKKIYQILLKIKKKNKIVKMGGSITPNSMKFLNELYKKKLINNIETRNAELKLTKNILLQMDKIIPEIFEFEIMWLKQSNLNKKINYYKKKDNLKRINEIRLRLKKLD
jgi:hypothetical protein